MHILVNNRYFILVKKNQDFRYLWFSQIVSLLGDWFNLIASAALVANLTNSGLAIGGIFLARFLPPFLLGPIVGVVADRFDRQKILIASDLLRAVVVLGFLFIRNEQDIWLLYVLTVLQLSISAFFEPARSAILPTIVSRQDLITANALSGATWSVMLALGAALGGLATALFGTTTAFLMDALTFLVSAWFIIQMPFWSRVDNKKPELISGPGWKTFVDGLRYLWGTPTILIIALLKASSAIAYGGTEIVQVIFAEEYFPLGDDGSGTLGIMYFTVGVGTGLGPILARRFTGDHPWAMYWAILFSYVTMIMGYLIFGWGPTLTILLIGIFLRTLGSGTNWVYSSSLLQMAVPSYLLGRIFAFDMAMVMLAQSISTVWAGWAKDQLGMGPHEISLAMAGVSLIMATGWGTYMIIYSRRKQLKPLPD